MLRLPHDRGTARSAELTTSQAYYFRRVPAIEHPPSFPPPDPAADPSWYGEIYVRYPLSTTLTPIHFGYLMQAAIELRLIMNDLAVRAFGNVAQQELPHEQLLNLLSRLESWKKDLPPIVSAQNISLPCQLKLQ